jgi:hypothetical protein
MRIDTRCVFFLQRTGYGDASDGDEQMAALRQDGPTAG